MKKFLKNKIGSVLVENILMWSFAVAMGGAVCVYTAGIINESKEVDIREKTEQGYVVEQMADMVDGHIYRLYTESFEAQQLTTDFHVYCYEIVSAEGGCSGYASGPYNSFYFHQGGGLYVANGEKQNWGGDLYAGQNYGTGDSINLVFKFRSLSGDLGDYMKGCIFEVK